MTDRIQYLESKIPEGVDIEDKYGSKFDKYARYMGNGVYQWDGILATDTRELFLMGVLNREKIQYKEE